MTHIDYHETLKSWKTTALFITLTLVFLALFLWRALTDGFDGIAISLLTLSCFFLFYTINYRKLEISLKTKTLILKFGIFHCRIPFNNVVSIQLDQIPAFHRYGGAGIHFLSVHGRYRMSMNFLEYPRVVVTFRHKVGPVRDLSFSTRSPDQLINLITNAIRTEDQT